MITISSANAMISLAEFISDKLLIESVESKGPRIVRYGIPYDITSAIKNIISHYSLCSV